MKIVAKVSIAPTLNRVFRYLLTSEVSAIHHGNNRGLRVAIPFNSNWIRIGISRDKETKKLRLVVEGAYQKDGPSVFEYSHTGDINTAKEFQSILIQLVRKVIDEFGATIAEKLIQQAIFAIQKANALEGEQA